MGARGGGERRASCVRAATTTEGQLLSLSARGFQRGLNSGLGGCHYYEQEELFGAERVNSRNSRQV